MEGDGELFEFFGVIWPLAPWNPASPAVPQAGSGFAPALAPRVLGFFALTDPQIDCAEIRRRVERRLDELVRAQKKTTSLNQAALAVKTGSRAVPVE